jgi:hypothetical protein
MASTPEVVMGYGHGDSKLCARVDISKASQADDVNIDDEVVIVIRGKVKRLEGPEQFKDTDYMGGGKSKPIIRKLPGKIEVEILDMTVKTEGDFDGMMDDE